MNINLRKETRDGIKFGRWVGALLCILIAIGFQVSGQPLAMYSIPVIGLVALFFVKL